MACQNCSCGTGSNTATAGCGSKGGCSSGSCNKLNTFDWLAHIDLPESSRLDLVEVSFKNGARKEFFRKPHYLHLNVGDYVLVDSPSGGYDLGRVSLGGELVRVQMRKKKIRENGVFANVLRVANERDLERMREARALEKETLFNARVIAQSLNLRMKIGDVEYQGDKRKVTLYYTADGRIDFRELIRIYAREFRVKIEMRQIGARQESARIGGIGACGRELCCSTWLSEFKSVSTVAARYQNLAINQTKLSGQCGRLKCCLNYELKTYLDALKHFPRNLERLDTERGTAILMKTDIFKRLMYFAYRQDYGFSEFYPLTVDQVWGILKMAERGEKVADLQTLMAAKEREIGFVDGIGSIELPSNDRRKRRNNNNKETREPREQRPKRQTEPNPNGAMTLDDEPIVLPSLEKEQKPKRERPQREPRPRNNNPKKEKTEASAEATPVEGNPTTPTEKTEAQPTNHQNGGQPRGKGNPNNNQNQNRNNNPRNNNNNNGNGNQPKGGNNNNQNRQNNPRQPQPKNPAPVENGQPTGETVAPTQEPKNQQQPRQKQRNNPRNNNNNNNGNQPKGGNNNNQNPPINPESGGQPEANPTQNPPNPNRNNNNQNRQNNPRNNNNNNNRQRNPNRNQPRHGKPNQDNTPPPPPPTE